MNEQKFSIPYTGQIKINTRIRGANVIRFMKHIADYFGKPIEYFLE